MLDRNALAKAVSADRRGDQLAESVLELLVLGDADGSTRFERRHRAATALRASPAGFGVELDDGAGLEVFDLAGRALNRAIAHVDDEVGFGEELAVAGDPWLAEDFAATREHVLYERTADVAAIDVKRGYLGAVW